MELSNAINWFEIPVSDFERAKQFYSAIYGYEMPEMMMQSTRMGMLPYQQDGGVGGAICYGEGYEPTMKGARVYLNGGKDLNGVLGKVEAAGGKVILGKTKITDEIGYFAIFTDTEGNQLSLHSPS